MKMVEMQKKIDELVSLGETKELSPPKRDSFDATKHIGKRSKIVRITEHKKEWSVGEEPSYYVKFESDVIEKLGDVEVRASKIVGLQSTEGWYANSKMGLELKRFGVKHYRDLQDKEIIIQTRTAKDGRVYLTW